MQRFDVSVSLKDGLRTTITARDQVNHSDALASAGGLGVEPNPEELVLSALGSCTAMTLALYARRKGWALTGVDVAVSLAEGGIQRDVKVHGDLPQDQVERLLEIANKCPVHKMLTAPPPIASTIARA